MKHSFSRLLTLCLLAYILLAGGFVFLLVLEHPGLRVLIIAGVFLAVLAALFGIYLFAVRRKMNGILGEFSLLVQELIDGKTQAHFPEHEDSLLSKLQSRIMQLAGLLTAQKQRYRQDSLEIKSLISDISHQLKTPLANLGMYSELLQDEALPEAKRREFTGTLSRQIEKLSWLMDSLIKLSRLESGIISLQVQNANLTDTMLAAIKQAFPAAERLQTAIVLDGSVELTLRHDPKWTAEALYNILDNALKYGGAGGEIIVTLHRYDLFARIDIADRGPGIPEEEVNAVFRRFYRGSRAGDTEGAGIGLYLSRKIVSEQGGYIKIRAGDDGGSVFSVFLPLRF
ncbi:sensor histidine kinase KdpD [Paenibacillus sp. NFR01]|uniref:sensor histidine kinase n=1 Tax=Paenibacillus sp. NFR01 TaxID=1566279 RepID=UPI0008C6C6A5|nr:HAMP domain-containing sensor histidine kinase [Paenibacillus sp. NFR01]SEU20807.1 Signal transduction histidine kinase [Paenibacillus sp. NFR01]